MDMLNIELNEADQHTPRDVVFGPKVIPSAAYGVSLKLPDGWMAATLLGEVYGIEPLLRNDGLIYVSGQVAGLADIVASYASPLDMGFVRLLPESTPFVDGNTVSMHCSVQGVGLHEYGYVTTAVTPGQKAITFAALFDEPAALLFRGVTCELADSVTDLKS
jgi:hypothetical protein